MSEHIHSSSFDDRWKLKEVLAAISADPAGGFIQRLASSSTRWSSVPAALHGPQRVELESLAYSEGFSPSNLKAHYVLDEEFVDNGTAFVLFSLVGSTWAHVVRLKDQKAVVPPDAWLNGEAQ